MPKSTPTRNLFISDKEFFISPWLKLGNANWQKVNKKVVKCAQAREWKKLILISFQNNNSRVLAGNDLRCD